MCIRDRCQHPVEMGPRWPIFRRRRRLFWCGNVFGATLTDVWWKLRHDFLPCISLAHWLPHWLTGYLTDSLQPINIRELLKCIWSYAHRCLMNISSLFLSSTFNGIDKITGRFMAKVDRQKPSKIRVNLTMPQRTLKRRSPNPYNTRLKWTVIENTGEC